MKLETVQRRHCTEISWIFFLFAQISMYYRCGVISAICESVFFCNCTQL